LLCILRITKKKSLDVRIVAPVQIPAVSRYNEVLAVDRSLDGTSITNATRASGSRTAVALATTTSSTASRSVSPVVPRRPRRVSEITPQLIQRLISRDLISRERIVSLHARLSVVHDVALYSGFKSACMESSHLSTTSLFYRCVSIEL